MFYKLLICVIVLPNICQSDSGSQKLKLVQVVYRHGERSPMKVYPDDRYNISTWEKYGAIGYEQLTWRGMKQHYELGQFFKKRYIDDSDFHLLGPKYDPREFYVRSTDVDRTLMSAYCNLAGMFPPAGNMSPWNVNHTLQWQPIPVHTVPVSMDSLLSQDAVCPKADQLFRREQQTDEFKNKMAQYKDFLVKMSNWTGVAHEDLVRLWSITDALFIESTNGMGLPDWAKELWPPGNQNNQTVFDVMNQLRGWEIALHFGEPREKARLRGGPLIKQMVTNINLTINNTDKTSRFYMYSSHDNTLVAFMKALQVFNGLLPPFASALILELYQDNVTNQYSVSLLYKNETDTNHTLQIPGCAALCPFSQFVSLTADMIPADWNTLCTISEPPATNEALVIGLGIGAGILLLVVLVGIVYIIRKKRGGTEFANYYAISDE